MKDSIIPIKEQKAINFPLNTRPTYSHGITSLWVKTPVTLYKWYRLQSHIPPVGVTLYIF